MPTLVLLFAQKRDMGFMHFIYNINRLTITKKCYFNGLINKSQYRCLVSDSNPGPLDQYSSTLFSFHACTQDS